MKEGAILGYIQHSPSSSCDFIFVEGMRQHHVTINNCLPLSGGVRNWGRFDEQDWTGR